jgi:anion-transporting  ArsA/GET3 family ATPase
MNLYEGVELVVVTGKGGAGKSTVALALAMGEARGGRRVVVCEVAGQARAARLHGRPPPAPGEEFALGDGLWTITIDPALALDEWAARQLHSRRLVGAVMHTGAFAGFVNAAPGARELLAITKAWELGRSERWARGRRGYDLVVLDAPASGHAVGMLRTPRTFAEIARVGPIAAQARQVAALLEDPGRSAIVAVTEPAELPVSETLELQERLGAALGRSPDRLIANRVLPRRFSAGEVARVEEAAPASLADAARRQHGQAAVQMAQLRRLRRHARAPVATLPLVATAALGVSDVRALADRLAHSR